MIGDEHTQGGRTKFKYELKAHQSLCGIIQEVSGVMGKRTR